MKSPTSDNINMQAPQNGLVDEIIDIFVLTIGFLKRSDVVASSHVVNDFKIDTDDLSIFAQAIEKHFKIKPTQSEWFNVGTIEQIASLVQQHLMSKNVM